MFIETSARQFIAPTAYYGGPHFELSLQTFYPGGFCVENHTETRGGGGGGGKYPAVYTRTLSFHDLTKPSFKITLPRTPYILCMLSNYYHTVHDKRTWQYRENTKTARDI